MADGVVVVEGTVAQIVGDARVAVVEAGRWAAAFDAVERAGMRVALVGTSLRVPGVSAPEVRDALRDVPANVDEAPATLEERFLELTRSRERI